MRSKISECGMEIQHRWSDLMAGDNLWDGRRETGSPPRFSVRSLEPMRKWTTLWKAWIQRPTSVPVAVPGPRLQIERVRVW